MVSTRGATRYCLTDSRSGTHNPGTGSRVTNATLCTALQAGHCLRHLCARIPQRSCSTLISMRGATRYCLTDSCSHTPNPGTVSRATNAALSTALQADHSLRQACGGMSVWSCSTLISTQGATRYCLTDSCPGTPNPGTVSRVTNAALSTALQAGRRLRQACGGMSPAVSEERDQPGRLVTACDGFVVGYPQRSVRDGISLEGCTKRSGRNRGRSPR